MRRLLLVACVASLALAGCASHKSYHCPSYVPQEAVQQIEKAKAEYDSHSADNKDQVPWPDADLDCIPDNVETALGTNPNDQGSFPTEAQLQQAFSNSTSPFGGPESPPSGPSYVWESDSAAGSFTTTVAVSPGGQGGFEVPEESKQLFANFTIGNSVPGEVTIRLNPPSCAGNPQCTAIPEQTTQGGLTSFNVEEPETGAYTISFFAANGVATGSWSVTLANLVPAGSAAPPS